MDRIIFKSERGQLAQSERGQLARTVRAKQERKTFAYNSSFEKTRRFAPVLASLERAMRASCPRSDFYKFILSIYLTDR